MKKHNLYKVKVVNEEDRPGKPIYLWVGGDSFSDAEKKASEQTEIEDEINEIKLISEELYV